MKALALGGVRKQSRGPVVLFIFVVCFFFFFFSILFSFWGWLAGFG